MPKATTIPAEHDLTMTLVALLATLAALLVLLSPTAAE